MIANLLPNEATHTSLDLFEKQPLLITFENAFDQKIVHLTNKLHQIKTFARNLRPLGYRNELIKQLRLLHHRRHTNPQEFRLQFQRNKQKADML